MRPETGPMQFDDDWPGIFIRGDNAHHFAMQLELALKGDNPMAIAYANALINLLRSCYARTSPTVQRVTKAEIIQG